jgi:hypothetical protein
LEPRCCRRTDMTRLTVAFRNFWNAQTNHCCMWHWNDGVLPKV